MSAKAFILVAGARSVRSPWRVKGCCLLVLVLAGPIECLAQQDNAISLDDLVQAGQQWAEENLDESALGALQEADQAKMQQLFRDLQGRFQGEHVIDLAPLKKTAEALLPLLEAHEEDRALRAVAQSSAGLPRCGGPVPADHPGAED